MDAYRLPALIALTILLGACGGRLELPPWAQLEEQVEAGHVGGPSASSLSDANALFRGGLARAHPGSPIYDPAVAREHFRRLVMLHPNSSQARMTGYLGPMVDALAVSESALQRCEAEESASREEAEELGGQLSELEERLLEATRETAAQRQAIQRLEADVRARDQRIQELETTLQRLRSIDLRSQD